MRLRLLLPIALATLCAQDFKEQPTFSTDVRVVNLLATVRDRDGNIVKDLTRDDFELRENGHKKPIEYFSTEGNLPLTIGLLVDTSRSMQTIFDPVRAASGRFFEQVLKPDRDQAFVISFDIKVNLLQNMTQSREQLDASLDQLRIPERASTLLYDAICRASDNHMHKESGRKAIVLLSDGADFRSRNSLTNAIERAQRADTLIYAVLYTHRPNRPLRKMAKKAMTRGRKTMLRLAEETGGAFYEVTDDNPIEKIYAQIEEELRTQYSIGYKPDLSKSDGKFRTLTLTVKRKGLTVRTRTGYYPE